MKKEKFQMLIFPRFELGTRTNKNENLISASMGYPYSVVCKALPTQNTPDQTDWLIIKSAGPPECE